MLGQGGKWKMCVAKLRPNSSWTDYAVMDWSDTALSTALSIHGPLQKFQWKFCVSEIVKYDKCLCCHIDTFVYKNKSCKYPVFFYLEWTFIGINERQLGSSFFKQDGIAIEISKIHHSNTNYFRESLLLCNVIIMEVFLPWILTNSSIRNSTYRNSCCTFLKKLSNKSYQKWIKK